MKRMHTTKQIEEIASSVSTKLYLHELDFGDPTEDAYFIRFVSPDAEPYTHVGDFEFWIDLWGGDEYNGSHVMHLETGAGDTITEVYGITFNSVDDELKFVKLMDTSEMDPWVDTVTPL